MESKNALSIIFKMREDSEFFRGLLAGRNAIPFWAEAPPKTAIYNEHGKSRFGVSPEESIYLKRLVDFLDEMSSSVSKLLKPDIRDT